MGIQMRDEQFSLGKEVIEHLENNGYEAYFVGGCVRDLLLNRQIKDIDIATSALPDSVESIFEKVIPLGVEHGTVIVRHHGISFEVTTFREEGQYSDSRRPDQVKFITNVESDLKRRDFTINALAMTKEGDIIDLFNGQNDLNNKVIKAVGNVEIRFEEDALRIMRAIRFSSQLGFSIDNSTLDAMKNIKSKLAQISIERITIEMEKLIEGDYINKGFNYLIEADIFNFLPIFSDYPEHIRKLPTPLLTMNAFSDFIALSHFLDPTISVNRWIKAWKCSNKTKNRASQLTNALVYYNENNLDAWLVYKLSPANYDSFLKLTTMLFTDKPLNKEDLLKLADELPIQSISDLAINGHDLLTMYPDAKKGIWIKYLLSNLEQQVVLGNLDNNMNNIKEWIKWNPPAID